MIRQKRNSTITEDHTISIDEVTPMGGDVQLRLRPTRHTEGQQHADERS
jgi:diaminohydroxyphosphoribosylaminopyrimidine deaminase/5-amino-6-(5-phosphoribosylamino)uracil reductase